MAGRPVILAGCGRLGSAIVEGWLKTGGLDPRDLIILTPSHKPIAETARAAGARINPGPEALATADRLVLAVKPAMWREAAADVSSHLAEDAVVISVMAGVRSADLATAFGSRLLARVMPTTGVAAGRGVAGLWADDEAARAAASALFAPIADLAPLSDEALIDAATAVAGSGQAYVFAFVEALAGAGRAQGLSEVEALTLARGAVISAAAAMEAEPDASPADLTARVASPGGTTRAALAVLGENDALDALIARAADAASARARELAKS